MSKLVVLTATMRWGPQGHTIGGGSRLVRTFRATRAFIRRVSDQQIVVARLKSSVLSVPCLRFPHSMSPTAQ